MNILLSSSGRQVFLANAFKNALNGNGKVYAADNNATSSSLEAADKGFVAPAFTSKKYIPWLVNLCKENDVRLLITLNVDDLLVLEKERAQFEKINCKLVGGPLDSIEISYDKYKVVEFLKKLNMPAVKTWLVDDPQLFKNDVYPLIAKPRFGKGARGNVIINTPVEFQDFIEDIKSQNTPYVIQELIDGEEYGFDIINDFNANFLTVIGRRKIIQQDGESLQVMTVNPEFWKDTALRLSKELRHQGTVNFDVMFKNGMGYLIDINFRFSGDYVFSHIAGANTPKIYVDILGGNDINIENFTPKCNVMIRRVLNGATVV
jgi:carbamoyl-phosphate synthase large subunit